jgi:hypothetical protein
VAAAQQVESSTSRQHSKCGRAEAPSAHAPNPPPSQHRERGEGVRAAASAIRSHFGPNRDVRNTIEARLQAESINNYATTMIADTDGAMTVITTVTAVGYEARGVRGPLARASATQSSLRASVLRPTYLGTTGTPTPSCGSRTTGSLATSGERWTTTSSSRTYCSTLATPQGPDGWGKRDQRALCVYT